MTWATTESWLLHSALGGGLLLLLACAVMRWLLQPVRRQAIGQWGLVAALLVAVLSLAPSWLALALPWRLEASSVLPQQQLDNNRQARETTRLWPGRSEPARPEAESPSAWSEGWTASPDGAPANEIDGEGEAPAEPARQEPRPPTKSPGKTPSGDAVPVVEGFALQNVAPGNAATPADDPLSAKGPASLAGPALAKSSWALPLTTWVLLGYAVGAAFFLGRWLLGHFVLWRLLLRSFPAPEAAGRLFRTMTAGMRPKPRLLVSARLRVPLSLGLFRPTVLLPAQFCHREAAPNWPWIFAHELTHLRRGDAWSCLLFSLGQAVYFYVPWFWWLRRQVRLCQEYIADAAAVEQEARTEEYAQFLLNLTAAPAVPVSAIGGSGYSSDLFRRIAMLLQKPILLEKCCSRIWSVAVAAGLVGLALLFSGLGLTAGAAAADDNPTALAQAAPDQGTARQEDKKATEPRDKGNPYREALQKALENLPPGAGPDEIKRELAKAMERVQSELEKQRKIIQEQQEKIQKDLELRARTVWAMTQSSHGRLGVRVETPGAALIDQLDLPKGQGLVVDSVQPDSAAAKAGLKANDILLELNGKPVPTQPRDFAKMVEEIKPNTPVDAVVLRKGKKETIKGLSLPEAKAQGPRFRLEVPRGAGEFPGFPRGPGGFTAAPRGPAGLPGRGGMMPGPGGSGRMMPGATALAGRAGDGHTIMTTMLRTNDRFTTRYEEGSLIITLTGTVADGKAKLKDLTVQDGSVTNSYTDVDKVPERYRDKVKHLVEMSERGNIKIEIKTPRDAPGLGPPQQ